MVKLTPGSAAMRRYGRPALALLSGLALPLALAPFYLWPLALLAPALLLAVLWRTAPRRALLLGYLHGLGRYGLGVSWVYVSIHVYGGAAPWLATLLVVFFVAALALLPALMAWLFARLQRGGSGVGAALFTGLWVLLEWLLTWLLTGFPWLFLGYAQLETPLAGYAPLGGVLLVSLLTVASASLLWLAVVRRRWQWMLSVGALWLLGAGLAQVQWSQPSGESLRVALVQGAVPQQLKWQRGQQQPILRHYLQLTDPHWAEADVIIWPEAALTWFAREVPQLLDDLDAHARQSGVSLVLGMPDVARGSGAFQNTALALGLGSGRYVKQRLVPFGEYVPLESLLRGSIAFLDLPMSRASPGPPDQPPLKAAGVSLALAICYEIVYPELVRQLADAPGLLVTLSNDTWFGDSLGPPQHLQMARMRALELGRPLLRATNDGITAVVGPAGEVQARLGRFRPDVLSADVAPHQGRTPYAVLGGSWVVVVAFLLVVAGLRRSRRRDDYG